MRSLGARHVVDYTAERFEDVVADQDVVIDLVGNVGTTRARARSTCCARTGWS